MFKFKWLLKRVLPTYLLRILSKWVQLYQWNKRSFLQNSPQFVKELLFLKYGVRSGAWIETGTYLGTTTAFLAENFPHVHTIEANERFYEEAALKFRDNNVTTIHGSSEAILPTLLASLSGDINFWLDGHFSGGETFKGINECPVLEELRAIDSHRNNFSRMSIFVDDVRLFNEDGFGGYPSLDQLVEWAKRNNFKWKIEHDMFIMTQ